MVAPQANLAISKTAHPDPAYVGQVLTYTITVTNSGPDRAVHVPLVDTLPDTVTYISDDAGCALAGSSLSCSLVIEAGSSAVVHVRVIPTQAGPLTNQAVLDYVFDPFLGDNQVTSLVQALDLYRLLLPFIRLLGG